MLTIRSNHKENNFWETFFETCQSGMEKMQVPICHDKKSKRDKALC